MLKNLCTPVLVIVKLESSLWFLSSCLPSIIFNRFLVNWIPVASLLLNVVNTYLKSYKTKSTPLSFIIEPYKLLNLIKNPDLSIVFYW